MSIAEIEVMKGYIRLCDDGFRMGWHERNGGNFTCRMTADEVDECRPFFCPNRDWTPIGLNVGNLAGEHFISTGSGKFMRNMASNIDDNICIVEINSEGTAYRIVWGLVHGGVPTSEFASHLLNHSVKKAATCNLYRIIYHAHTPNVIALTFVLPLTAREFSRVLWKSMTECPIVFPSGIGVVPWMIPGGPDIAIASSELMKDYDAIIWAHHGTFCSGPDFDTTFGLMHTIEKSAEIYIKALSCGQGIRQTITDDELRQVAKAFNVKLNEKFLC
ncbi:MAG: rhamnulose-1-phosphate aldolase [Spirochaetaceae bacterium]|nr:rhamnulose-1-phosphate aldolase [Spirochaetaceae bacterium]